MKIALLLVLVLLFGCTSTTTPTSPDKTIGTASGELISVEIKNFAFSPATITVPKGTTVTWVQNDGAPHTVTADDNSFDSGSLAKGQTFSYTFNKAGTFDYFCIFHPNMKAKIIVTE